MEWIKQLESSLDYIENNLTNKIDVNELGKMTYTSGYHFQRMFSYITGVTLSEYIRRRRMTMACLDLKQGEKVIDVAQRYGYTSPDSFTKAFKKLIGVLPSDVLEDGVSLKSYPRIHFSMTIKGDVEMNYRIEKKAAFNVVGEKINLTDEVAQNFTDIPKFWSELAMSGKLEKIVANMSMNTPGVLGITSGFSSELDLELEYYVAVESEQLTHQELDIYEVPACTWAIFEGQGQMPKAIQDLEVRIITEWLPSSGYEYGNGPDIEKYINQNPENSLFEVWIPIVKKGEET